MRDAFKKFFAVNSAQPAASAEQEKEVVEMTKTTEANAQAAATTIAELTASLEQANATLATKEKLFAEMSTKFEQATSALNASEAAQATLAEQIAAKATAERTSKLSAVIGAVKAPAMTASLSALDDAAFDLVVSSMSANLSAEEKSSMFTEKGVSADAEVAPTVEKPVSFSQFTPKTKESK